MRKHDHTRHAHIPSTSLIPLYCLFSKGNAEKPNGLKYLEVNVINDNKVCLAKTDWMEFELMANMMCAGHLEG